MRPQLDQLSLASKRIIIGSNSVIDLRLYHRIPNPNPRKLSVRAADRRSSFVGGGLPRFNIEGMQLKIHSTCMLRKHSPATVRPIVANTFSDVFSTLWLVAFAQTSGLASIYSTFIEKIF